MEAAQGLVVPHAFPSPGLRGLSAPRREDIGRLRAWYHHALSLLSYRELAFGPAFAVLDSNRSFNMEEARATPSIEPPPLEVPSSCEITVLVPVLDEEGSVAELAQQTAEVLDGFGRSFEIVFVDDGSQDATVERVLEAREADGRVKLVCLRQNFGKAAALSAGIEHSTGIYVITIDGDLQDDPNEIPKLVEKLEAEGLDLVSGWKSDRQDPLSRRWLSRIFNWVTRRMARVELHDFNCGFKIYRREVLEQVPVYGELHRFIPVLASYRGFRIGEVRVRHHPRRHGTSKYGVGRIFKGPLDLMTVLFLSRYTRRPLHAFGALGGLLLTAGGGINVYLAIVKLRGGSLSNRPLLLLGVLLMVLGLQVLTTGLLAELLTFKNHERSETYTLKKTVGFGPPA